MENNKENETPDGSMTNKWGVERSLSQHLPRNRRKYGYSPQVKGILSDKKNVETARFVPKIILDRLPADLNGKWYIEGMMVWSMTVCDC